MADDEHAAMVALEEFFEPFDAFDVEVVRRFVEEQEVRLAHERLREADTRLLAAGEMLDVFLEIFFREAEAIGDAAQAALVVVAAEDFKAVHDAAVVIEQCRARFPFRAFRLHALFELGLFRAERTDVVKGVLELLVKRAAREVGRLLDIANRVIAVPLDTARVVLFLPHEDLHERRLARAIRADKADLVPARDLERDVLEKFVHTKGFCKVRDL